MTDLEGGWMHTNPDVDAWFASKRVPASVAIRRVREIILRADPRVSDYVKYGSLMFGCEGDFAASSKPTGSRSC